MMRRFLLASTAAVIALSAPSLVQAQADMTSTQAAGITSSWVRIAFTDEDRIIMLRYVRPRLPYGMTTAANGGVTPGSRVPDSIELHPFPAAALRESPHLRAYRYIQTGGRAYVVDPRNRIVIEDIG